MTGPTNGAALRVPHKEDAVIGNSSVETDNAFRLTPCATEETIAETDPTKADVVGLIYESSKIIQTFLMYFCVLRSSTTSTTKHQRSGQTQPQDLPQRSDHQRE